MGLEEEKLSLRANPETPVLKMAAVRCADHRCMGYLGADGKWRNFHGEILDVLEVISDLRWNRMFFSRRAPE